MSLIAHHRQLARIEDGIFKSLPLEDGQKWRRELLEAIPVGADLMVLYWQFMHWMLVDPEDGVINYTEEDRTKKVIRDVAALYVRLLNKGGIIIDEWYSAYAAAAAISSASFCGSAARDAAYAAVVDVDAAYHALAFAACALAHAAHAAGRCADAEEHFDYKLKATRRQAEKLLELLKSAPICESGTFTITAFGLTSEPLPHNATLEQVDAVFDDLCRQAREKEATK